MFITIDWWGNIQINIKKWRNKPISVEVFVSKDVTDANGIKLDSDFSYIF